MASLKASNPMGSGGSAVASGDEAPQCEVGGAIRGIGEAEKSYPHQPENAKLQAMSEDIRWKQRFHNFERAFLLLREAVERKPEALSMLEKEGVIQRFEYTFELAWKTLKDYLEEGGLVISPVTARQVIKEAFAAKVISAGEVWINMLDHRNLLSHTYDASVFEQAVKAIAEHYLPLMGKLHQFFVEKSVE
jgi:nucleotidyltransferase substrate binding protein (TIGR01987 family)